MSCTRFVTLLVLGVAVMLSGTVPAQDGFRRYAPDKFERATKTDDEGMIQWAKHDPGKCPTCAGVGKTKCKVCGGVTRHVDREGILEAQFLPYSPVWRSDPRNEMKADRALRGADTNPSVLAPFVKSSQVKGAIEDHDFWVRIRLREKQYKEPGDKSLETVEQSFVLYRVGKVWYLHGGRIDHVLFELPPESEPEGAKEDDDGFGTED